MSATVFSSVSNTDDDFDPDLDYDEHAIIDDYYGYDTIDDYYREDMHDDNPPEFNVGSLELFADGVWTQFCTNGFGWNEASVACRYTTLDTIMILRPAANVC